MYKPIDNPIATIDLEEPIIFMGSNITILALRKPTGKDVLRVGNPLRPTSTGGLDVDETKAFAMLGQLTGLPVFDCLDQMTAGDAVDAIYTVGGLFIRASKTRPETTSPESSNKSDEQ